MRPDHAHGGALGRISWVLAAVIAMIAWLLTAVSAQAFHEDDFELDGNTAEDADPAPPYDWETFLEADANGDVSDAGETPKAGNDLTFVAVGAEPDYETPDLTTFTTGSKDTLNIGPEPGMAAGWQCSKSNNVNPKLDILNAYTAAARDGDGDLYLFFGMELSSPNGSSNVAVWFLKDENVGCETTGNTLDFSGQHTDGDVLVVSEFTNGGTVANIKAYQWEGDNATGSLDTTPIASGNLCAENHTGDSCAIANLTGFEPPWNHPTKDNKTDELQASQFFEGGINLSDALNTGPSDPPLCFSTFVADTRSSPSLTATLFDYAAGSIAVCGDLDVHKWIDADIDGYRDASEVDGQGWTFNVYGPKDAATYPGSDPVGYDLTSAVCSGTTNTDGDLTCTSGSLGNLTPGTYLVRETQITDDTVNTKGGFVNTFAGLSGTGSGESGDATQDGGTPTIDTGSTVDYEVAVTVNGASVDFGNVCYTDVSLTANNIDSGLTGVFLWYQVRTGAGVDGILDTADDVYGARQDLTSPSQSGESYSATISDTLLANQVIRWGFGVNYGGSDPIEETYEFTSATAPLSLSAGAYPACAISDSGDFAPATIKGTKYKDADADGSRDIDETLIGGFTFKLYKGHLTTLPLDDTDLVATDNDTDGNWQFSSIDPGDYTVFEIGAAAAMGSWEQTQPASNGGYQIHVSLSDSGGDVTKDTNDADLVFGNTPHSKIKVEFLPQAKLADGTTDATMATDITCTDNPGGTASSNLGDTNTGGNTYESGSTLTTDQSQVVCTITFVDP